MKRQVNTLAQVAGAAETPAEAAERKRRDARRRFLIGGAAALPVIITMGQKQALAASAGVCASNLINTPDAGAVGTFFCHVN